jgi:nucleotide-binding universal stress UspA family protein
MYVVNPDLLSAPDMDQAQATVKKFERMGRSVLDAAQAWADLHGVRTRGDMRWGGPAEEIAAACQEMHVDYLVLGRSQIGKTGGLFDRSRLKQYVRHVEQQTGVAVVLSESDK